MLDRLLVMFVTTTTQSTVLMLDSLMGIANRVPYGVWYGKYIIANKIQVDFHFI